MARVHQHYAGKVTQVGNSKGIRPDAAFFKAHPEFGGEVQATVVAEGQVLLSAKSQRRSRGGQTETPDPIMVSFLAFLEEQMLAHPNRIRPLEETLLDEIGKLVDGIDGE